MCCCRNKQVQTQKLLWPLLTLGFCSPALSPLVSCAPQAGHLLSLAERFSPAKQESLEHCSAWWGHRDSKYSKNTKSQVSWSWGEQKGLSRATIQAVPSTKKALMGWQDMTKRKPRKGFHHHQSHVLSQAQAGQHKDFAAAHLYPCSTGKPLSYRDFYLKKQN